MFAYLDILMRIYVIIQYLVIYDSGNTFMMDSLCMQFISRCSKEIKTTQHFIMIMSGVYNDKKMCFVRNMDSAV